MTHIGRQQSGSDITANREIDLQEHVASILLRVLAVKSREALSSRLLPFLPKRLGRQTLLAGKEVWLPGGERTEPGVIKPGTKRKCGRQIGQSGSVCKLPLRFPLFPFCTLGSMKCSVGFHHRSRAPLAP